MSFFISTSFILRLSRVLSTWGGGGYSILHQSVEGAAVHDISLIQVCLICYLRPDVVVEALDETRNDPHCGQRSPAPFVLLEELPERITTHT